MPVCPALIKSSDKNSLGTKYESDELHMFNIPFISVTSAGM